MADYEFLGVDAIKRLLAKTSRVRGFINEKDKEPSWDGNIYLFEKPDVKENIKKIPTQVKGKNKNHHNKKKYNHYFDKADLENYYNDGGVLYFVVCFCNSPEEYKIYYNSLLPVKIENAIKSIDRKKQKGISLECKEFPLIEADMLPILNDFIYQRQKQLSFINGKIISIDDALLKTKELVCTKFSKASNNLPLDDLIGNDTYFYAKQNGIEIPVEYIKITESFKTIKASVSVNKQLFYQTVVFSKDEENQYIIIGKSLKLNLSNTNKKININISGTLSNRIKDLRFVLAVVKHGSFEINDVNIGGIKISSKSKIKEFKELLDVYESLQIALQKIGVSKDLDLDICKEKDWRNINIFINTIIRAKNKLKVPQDNTPFKTLKFGNVKLLLYFKKIDESYCEIYNYTDTDLVMGVSINNELNRLPFECALAVIDALDCDNVNIDNYSNNLKTIEPKAEFFDTINKSLLKIIDHYDKTQNKEYLKISEAVATWLKENYPSEKLVVAINEMQVKYRLKTLSLEDKQTLYALLLDEKGSSSPNYMALYCLTILLGEKDIFEEIKNKLSVEDLTEIEQQPISNLLKVAFN